MIKSIYWLQNLKLKVMKKLGKINLQNAELLEEKEMKAIYGGSGGGVSGDESICGSGSFTHVCECNNRPGTWCGSYGDGGSGAIYEHCGSSSSDGACREYRH